ncbi:hypothetical protein RZN05_00175 [Sphingomonas sp. HF-S4]|uniref:Uncharacterized protein n=1 Tax=Sphingomonas agrestis TaxID=3080540 RepID=A0ABU3Y265_9SPHN|nr:hypothetical protein [Sphingomonas sp. HF-S4]MDV3455381.1 hypothetical protein [Sphingomonas sp. HF-S4]
MIQAAAIDGKQPPSPALDWDGLIAEGRSVLGAMSDGRWTDFNAHDPGITLLEAFAYALTDLAYRAGHPIAELVTGPAEGPDRLLVGDAVTPADLRRVAIEVAGVRNAWIEPSEHPTLRLRYTPGAGEFDRAREPIERGDPVLLAGVHRVLIEKSSREDIASPELARTVAEILHRHRGLCEDFDTVDVLAPLPVGIAAELEIDDPARGDAVLLDIYTALADYCSPRPAWVDAAALRARGWATEAIYDGPATGGRRLDEDAAPRRRAALQRSDIIAALDRVPGVRAVRQVRMGADGDDLPGPIRWSLPIPSDRVPRFDPRASRIVLTSGGGFALDSSGRDDLAALFAERALDALDPPKALDPPAPPARDRRVGAYRPLRFDLPALYAVAPGGLEPEAGSARLAQVSQLRAYLALLDALLANHFAQLAGVGALLGSGETASYFAQPAEPIHTPAEPGSEVPLHADGFTADALQMLVEPPSSIAGLERRNRLLAHLLARYGEEAPLTLPPAGLQGPTLPAGRRVLDSRARFLSDFARLSAGRGTGSNLLDPADEPPLLDRIRLKLGLSEGEGARLRLVEHILLRPFAEDDGQAQALLAAAASPDPFSLQLSLVVDEALRPAADSLARVVRAETPAHLTLHVRWFGGAEFDAFAAAYTRWRTTLCTQRQQALGLDGGAA